MQQLHYYGDKIRSILIAVEVLMILTLPLFKNLIPVSASISILIVLLLVILTGLISPRQRIIVALTTVASAGAFIVFEYYAVITAQASVTGINMMFFVINELFAVLCLIATYLGVKSVRGLYRREE